MERIEIRKGDLCYHLKIIPEVRILLEDFARIHNTTMIDAGNQIFIGFFTNYHHFERPQQLIRETHRAIFPDKRAIYDALVSLAKRKRPRRRPLTLRNGGKLPFSSAESGSSDQDNL